jgi:pyruvate/2-oxoglutarate dehydrogenase complex dihydrolipoamide acyltransferase (E2) component
MSGTKQGTTITMPKLGESVTEGTLGTWLKQVGDVVDKYEPMVEVVTDKVTAEIPAPVSGTIVEIIGGEGETIPVGGVICVIDEGNNSAGTEPVAETPQAADPAVDASMPSEPIAEESTSGRGVQAAPIDLTDARARRDEAELLRTRSSPVVRRLAEEHEIDLTALQGSGVGGRVTKADILAVIDERRQPITPPQPQRAPQPAPEATPASQPTTQPLAPPMSAPSYAQPMPATQAAAVQLMPGDEVVDASAMRRQIADHMLRSVQTAPHVTVWMEADMSNIVRVRARHKDEFQTREGFSLTYFPFLVRVVVQALRKHPNVNAAWDNGRIIRRKALNIGVAVALEDGLIVPVIRAADEKNLVGIARAVNDLSTRARANQLQPDEVTGGTFTLNNPGTLGSVFSTPIIVQPQAAILSMESIVKRPVVVDDAIAIRPMMNLSLSIDHRILDGLAATRFLADVKAGLESFPVDAALD